MSNPSFTPMTEQQREEVRLKRISDQEWAKENLKTEYMDENYWRELSSKFSCRLPNWWLPSSEIKYLRRASKKVGIDLQTFVDSTGFPTIKQFVKVNSRLTALCMVGLLLEFHQDNLENNYTYRDKEIE